MQRILWGGLPETFKTEEKTSTTRCAAGGLNMRFYGKTIGEDVQPERNRVYVVPKCLCSGPITDMLFSKIRIFEQ